VGQSLIYKLPIKVESYAEVQAQTFEDGAAVGKSADVSFQWHIAAGKLITLTHAPNPKYASGGKGALVNAVPGSDTRYSDDEWLGFDGNDFEAVIDLGEPIAVSEVTLRFFNAPGQWIYPPKQASVAISADGKTYEQAIVRDISTASTEKIITTKVSLGVKSARYLKIKAQNLGTIPSGKPGAGHSPWLFVDELMVKYV
jgi:hexosaminidase